MPYGYLGPKKYRVAIDFFLVLSSQQQKNSILSLRSLRLCGEKENRIHFQYLISHRKQKGASRLQLGRYFNNFGPFYFFIAKIKNIGNRLKGPYCFARF